MKRLRLKTSIMWKHGTNWQFNAIILFLFGITLIPKIFTLENYNFPQQRYDFIDVAKEAPTGRTKGHTTRIFTTDDGLDEKFWLKYLGEDIRHAVHLQVDGNNNVIPATEDTKYHQHHQPTLKYDFSEEKQTRFVRQPSQDDDYKPEPVETLYKSDNKQYPTEKPETFHVKLTTASLPTPHYTKHEPTNTHQNINNRKLAKLRDKFGIQDKYNQNIIHLKTPRTLKAIHEAKDKFEIQDKYNQNIIHLKTQRALKAVHEPIVVNLPEMDNSEHQINEEHVPLVVQIPPIIYHQKAEIYPENLNEQ